MKAFILVLILAIHDLLFGATPYTVQSTQVSSDGNTIGSTSFVPSTNSFYYFDGSLHPGTKVLAPVAVSGSYNDLINKPSFDGSYPSLTSKPTLFDGTWGSLTSKPFTQFESLSATTATSGAYTWTYPTAFSGVPHVVATCITSDTTSIYNVSVTSKTATSCVFQVQKLSVVLVLTLNSAPGAITFDAMASYP